MELVLIIIILGIMATGIGGFITLSTQTYLNATNRDELIGNARFVIERLNRELRNAVPNSIRTKQWPDDGRQCIQFTPIVASTVYTDIKVAPEEASQTLTVIPFNDAEGNPYRYQCENSAASVNPCTDLVAVYPLTSDDIYSANETNSEGKIFHIEQVTNTTPEQIKLLKVGGVNFTEDSPTERLFITNEQVSYCVQAGFIVRFTELINSNEQAPTGSNSVYMAGYLTNDISLELPFIYQPATLKRNAVVQVHLEFTKEYENYVFDHEIHIINVP